MTGIAQLPFDRIENTWPVSHPEERIFRSPGEFSEKATSSLALSHWITIEFVGHLKSKKSGTTRNAVCKTPFLGESSKQLRGTQNGFV